MDKKSLIGIVLIGVIFFGFTIYSSRQQQKYQEAMAAYEAAHPELAQPIAGDSASMATASAASLTPAQPDSVLQAREIAVLGDRLVAAKKAEPRSITVENDVMRIVFSTRGGIVQSVTLKDYTRYGKQNERNDAVELFVPESAKFDLSFFIKNGLNNVKVNTSDYTFTADPVVRSDSSQIVRMRLAVAPDAALEYEYAVYDAAVPSRDYLVDYTVRLVNMAPYMSNQSSIGMAWSNTSYQNERGFKNENMYTTVAYRIPGEGSIDELSMSEGDKEEEISSYAREGYRVMVLIKTCGNITTGIDGERELLALIVIEDVIRTGAGETLDYFDRQGVAIKIISGDDPVTVSVVATRAGVRNAEKYVDCSALDDDSLRANVDNYTVFGRVSPDQKLVIVKALKAAGHVVGMTGDGINDVLALREADCSIAVAAGSDASKNVSKIVLLDNNFSSLPKVVQEGRRCINNLQRSASLFLIKTIYNTLFALIFMIIPATLPFIPKNLTLIGYITIGPPAFVLALEPNNEIVRGKFLPKVVLDACPTAFAIAIAVSVIASVGPIMGLSADQTGTSALIATVVLGLAFIIRISIPLNPIRLALIVVLAAFFTACFFVPFARDLFGLSETYDMNMLILTAPCAAGGVILMALFTLAFRKMRMPKFMAKLFEKL